MSPDLKGEISLLTGARQTMSAWTKAIESYDAIPAAYQGYFKTRFAGSQKFPYTIFTPALDKSLRKTTEKLICDADDAIQIMERTGSQVSLKSYPYKTVRALEMGSVLLYSWITICGLTSEGVVSSTTIEFNTTSARYFTIFTDKIRPALQGVDEASFGQEKDKLDYLSTLDFKFMNFGRESLVRGETILQIVLQPEIREPAWALLGWTFYRTITPAHLTILTDKEIILIRASERGKEIKGPHYGGIWQYIPLRSITSCALAEPANGRLTLSLSLASDEPIKKIFAVSSQPELQQLRARIQPFVV
jgi:hypothetical protein